MRVLCKSMANTNTITVFPENPIVGIRDEGIRCYGQHRRMEIVNEDDVVHLDENRIAERNRVVDDLRIRYRRVDEKSDRRNDHR